MPFRNLNWHHLNHKFKYSCAFVLSIFRTELRLDSLEDACVLENEEDDRLSDKHGCPAYVSPEILNGTPTYSGRAADMWSLGVMLYTVLVGRYPFHDADPTVLFSKIRRGQYNLPPSLSSKAKCLLKSILRQDPDLRLSAEACLCHPWLNQGSYTGSFVTVSNKFNDQMVPEVVMNTFETDFFTWHFIGCFIKQIDISTNFVTGFT